jgi:hypothetical protein
MVRHPIRALDVTAGAGRVFGTTPILILLGFFLTTKPNNLLGLLHMLVPKCANYQYRYEAAQYRYWYQFWYRQPHTR